MPLIHVVMRKFLADVTARKVHGSALARYMATRAQPERHKRRSERIPIAVSHFLRDSCSTRTDHRVVGVVFLDAGVVVGTEGV